MQRRIERQAATVPIALNPSLDAQALARTYARQGHRMQLRDLLEPEAARSVHDALEQVPWGMAFNDGASVTQLSGERLAQLSNAEAAEMMAGIRDRARSEYQFLYSFFPILTAYFSPEAPRLPIFDFYEFLNSEPVLDFIRELTGLPNIRWADAQATWFKPGHFLKAHTDQEAATGRVAAYVMNLSPMWERDWGGFLQFFDAHDNIDAAFKPTFNALSIFTIPQLHSVSMVSTYVTAKRTAVTGWFRSDEPPGPIGARG
jgi:Rps23 Pro-64 3,4-dihydroxylase Tpa1-like proline 4-hydroxylase